MARRLAGAFRTPHSELIVNKLAAQTLTLTKLTLTKLTLLALALPLVASGCDNKKKPANNPVSEPLAAPTPQVYTPSNTAPMTGMSGDTGGTTITPLDLNTPTSSPPPAPTQTRSRTGTRSPSVDRTVDRTVQRPSATRSPSMTGTMKAGSTYTVKSGDSLSEIAAKAYGKGGVKKGVTAIKKANSLKSDVIRIGQKLKIPSM